LKNIYNQFTNISLEEADKWSLLDRVDKKFVMHDSQLEGLLQKLVNEYYILQIEGRSSLPYQTVYYDTDELSMYHVHHNRKLNRYKIRIRTYLSTGEKYLEIKFRSNKGRSEKTRIISENITELKEELPEEFIQRHTIYNSRELIPRLATSFFRTTLFHKKNHERVTIDREIAFQKGENKKILPGLVLLETKTLRHENSSMLIKVLKETKILQMRMSKYCTGINLLYPHVKSNRFKEKINKINSICYGK
jgi:hypothetical protein